jgi:hypothetical protein
LWEINSSLGGTAIDLGQQKTCIVIPITSLTRLGSQQNGRIKF